MISLQGVSVYDTLDKLIIKGKQTMNKLTIKTDHKWKDLIYGCQLTAKERKEIDYLTDEEIEMRQFFRYKNNLYDTGEFLSTWNMPEDSDLKNWDAYQSDSFFSGILIKYDQYAEKIKIGTYYS